MLVHVSHMHCPTPLLECNCCRPALDSSIFSGIDCRTCCTPQPIQIFLVWRSTRCRKSPQHCSLCALEPLLVSDWQCPRLATPQQGSANIGIKKSQSLGQVSISPSEQRPNLVEFPPSSSNADVQLGSYAVRKCKLCTLQLVSKCWAHSLHFLLGQSGFTK